MMVHCGVAVCRPLNSHAYDVILTFLPPISHPGRGKTGTGTGFFRVKARPGAGLLRLKRGTHAGTGIGIFTVTKWLIEYSGII